MRILLIILGVIFALIIFVIASIWLVSKLLPEEYLGNVFDIDEFSLENLDLDKMLKVINLRKKLKKIEKERDLINHDPDEN